MIKNSFKNLKKKLLIITKKKQIEIKITKNKFIIFL